MRPQDIFQPLHCTGALNPTTERFHVVCRRFVLDSTQSACWRCVLCLWSMATPYSASRGRNTVDSSYMQHELDGDRDIRLLVLRAWCVAARLWTRMMLCAVRHVPPERSHEPRGWDRFVANDGDMLWKDISECVLTGTVTVE